MLRAGDKLLHLHSLQDGAVGRADTGEASHSDGSVCLCLDLAEDPGLTQL